jgi:hypothetical protein
MMEELPQQLFDAITGLELTFLDCERLVELSRSIETAAWCYNSITKEQKILFNPAFLETLDQTGCEIVIRHEILHKSLYKEISRTDLDPQLLNIALDIGISRVLSRSYNADAFENFSNEVYGKNPDIVNSVLALAWYGLVPDRIGHDQIRKYYKELWTGARDPSPMEIYYRILEISGYEEALPDWKLAVLIPGNDKGETGGDSANGNGPGNALNQDVHVRNIPEGDLEYIEEDEIGTKVLCGSPGNCYEKWRKEIQVQKERTEATGIEQFIQRIESVDILDQTAERITNSIHTETRRQIYPIQPSRLGHIYIRTGISQILHQYWNKVSSNRIPRLNIYVDVSPSMSAFREKEVFLIDRLKDLFPSTFFVFGTTVKEFKVSDFAAGKYPVAGGTDFNPVVRHLMNSEVECGVIFTDGEAYVSSENQVRFGRSGKRLFTVYFNSHRGFGKRGPDPVKSDLDKVSEEVMQIDLFEAQTDLTFRAALK